MNGLRHPEDYPEGTTPADVDGMGLLPEDYRSPASRRVIYTRVPMHDGTVRVMRWVRCYCHPHTGYVCTATRDVRVGGGSDGV